MGQRIAAWPGTRIKQFAVTLAYPETSIATADNIVDCVNSSVPYLLK
jgi:hypothetical protein